MLDKPKRGSSLSPEELKEVKQGITRARRAAIRQTEREADDALALRPTGPGSPIVSDQFKNFLEEPEVPGGVTRLRRIMHKMYEVAISDSPKNTVAAEFLVERGFGKAKLADEDRDALAKGGVQLVYIEAPQVPDAEERLALPGTPEFLDAEFTEEK